MKEIFFPVLNYSLRLSVSLIHDKFCLQHKPIKDAMKGFSCKRKYFLCIHQSIKRHLRSDFFGFRLFACLCFRESYHCHHHHCPVSRLNLSQALAVGQITSGSRILWYTEEFMLDSMTARCPDPVVVKQAQIISPPPPYLTVGTRCLCQHAVFGFLQTCCCALWPNISSLVWSVQRTLFQKSCGLFRCSFANLSCAVMFF